MIERRDPSFDSDSGNVRGGFDPQARNTCRHEILEQIPVIAGDLHHEAVLAQTALTEARLHRFAGMSQQGIAKGGKIEVLAEKIDGRDNVGDLQEPAGFAQRDSEWELGFGFRQIRLGEQIICQGLNTEIQHWAAMGGSARSTQKRGHDCQFNWEFTRPLSRCRRSVWSRINGELRKFASENSIRSSPLFRPEMASSSVT